MKIIGAQHQFNSKSLPHMVMKVAHFFSNILTRVQKQLKFYVVTEVSIPHHYLTKCDMVYSER
jgi:hypothetical protein